MCDLILCKHFAKGSLQFSFHVRKIRQEQESFSSDKNLSVVDAWLGHIKYLVSLISMHVRNRESLSLHWQVNALSLFSFLLFFD